MPFHRVGHQTEQKHVSLSSLCLSGNSLVVQARGYPAAMWCTIYWQSNREGLSNQVRWTPGDVGRCLVLVLSEAERDS